jgi:S1-C subfamily serine protease
MQRRTMRCSSGRCHIVFVLLVLIVSTLSCNAGGSPSPDLNPVEPTQASVEPTVQPTEASPDDGGGNEPAPTPSTVERPTSLTPEKIAQISKSAVQIWAGQYDGATFEPIWSGSGTIISPTGEILTNCHVACGAPVLVISMTESADQPPEDRYIGEVTHYDELLDLAIIQITKDIDGNPVSPTDLPYLNLGNSNDLMLGEDIYIFGYPGVGGSTITFTTGAVSGFESAEIEGGSQRVIIKTDAEIASGNSGGTAVDLWGNLVAVPTSVNPDVREGVTLAGLGILRPVNLINIIRNHPGTPPSLDEAGLPPTNDPDPYEPDDDLDTAYGPVSPGESITAYISWASDVDVYWFTARTTRSIDVDLAGPFGADYDLYLVDDYGEMLAYSESDSSDEIISYNPTSAGTYYVAVVPYYGSSASTPYTLTIQFDAGTGGATAGGGITITGQAVDAYNGRPLSGGLFGILQPGATCSQFFAGSAPDMSLVDASAETNSRGIFTLNGVTRGHTYTAFFIHDQGYICEENWLEVPADAVDADLGAIEMTFE